MTDLTIPQQLQQLVAGQVIRPEGEQSYAFRHALLHEAVYGTLLRRERREVHGAVARALEALYAGTLDEHLADLAHHYFENEAWDKALSYARRAGELVEFGETKQVFTRPAQAITESYITGRSG